MISKSASTDESPSMIRTVIVEDNETALERYVSLIMNEHEIDCLAGYPTAEKMLERLEEDLPDVILMDIELPGISGTEATAKVKAILPSTDVLMLTHFSDEDSVFKSLCAGATGYIVKGDPGLADRIRESRSGAPMSPMIARMVRDEITRARRKSQEAELTTREKEILMGLADGLSEKRISDNLFISPHTLHQHCKNIYRKLHVHTQAQAVAKAIRENML